MCLPLLALRVLLDPLGVFLFDLPDRLIIYIYIYIYTYTHIHIYIYIYIYSAQLLHRSARQGNRNVQIPSHQVQPVACEMWSAASENRITVWCELPVHPVHPPFRSLTTTSMDWTTSSGDLGMPQVVQALRGHQGCTRREERRLQEDPLPRHCSRPSSRRTRENEFGTARSPAIDRDLRRVGMARSGSDYALPRRHTRPGAQGSRRRWSRAQLGLQPASAGSIYIYIYIYIYMHTLLYRII